MPEPSLKIELVIEITPRLVSVGRRFIEEAMEKTLDDVETASRVGMAAHELLENVAKYGLDKRADLRVSVREGRINIYMSNRTTDAHINRLKRRFAEMCTYEDPFELYFDLMRRDQGVVDVSGLGLARIWAEGEMSLTLETKGDLVIVMAAAPVPAGKAKDNG